MGPDQGVQRATSAHLRSMAYVKRCQCWLARVYLTACCSSLTATSVAQPGSVRDRRRQLRRRPSRRPLPSPPRARSRHLRRCTTAAPFAPKPERPHAPRPGGSKVADWQNGPHLAARSLKPSAAASAGPPAAGSGRAITTCGSPTFVDLAVPDRRAAAARRPPWRSAPQLVWVEGRWDWQNGNWVWAEGRWEKERPGKRWRRLLAQEGRSPNGTPTSDDLPAYPTAEPPPPSSAAAVVAAAWCGSRAAGLAERQLTCSPAT
jgi:hypothetical protein